MIRKLSLFTILFAGFALLSPSAVVGQQDLNDLFPGQGGFGGGFGGEGSGEPVSVEAKLIPIDQATVDVEVTVTIAPGYHIYSMKPLDGSKPTRIQLDASGDEFALAGRIKASRPPKVVDSYGLTLEEYFDQISWTQRLVSKSGSIAKDLVIGGEVTGQYCSDSTCMDIDPPLTFEAKLPADFDPAKLPAHKAAATSPSASTPKRSQKSEQTIVPDFGDPSEKSPVKFKVSVSPGNAKAGDYVVVSIQATMDKPWHIYSTTMGEVVGGTPTTIKMSSASEDKAIGQFKASRQPQQSDGVSPGDVLEYFEDEVTWQREFLVSSPSDVFEGVMNFQICTHGTCKLPIDVPFRVALDAASDDVAVAGTDASNQDEQTSWLPFILAAMGAGFVALLTPCVFPMIPVTVSYFLKQGETNPGSTIRLAVIYCIGIIGAFTVLGLAVSVVLGPTALNALANNRWLNLFFAFVFTVFGLMLLGMFEFQIPSWVLTWSSKKQESGGVIGVLFMALTFTLVSFTCTFAFVGNILVLAASGQSYLRPIVGMAAFSAAFASPFFLLALFPSFLKKLPKSGGWMNRVKVTLGLLELAIVVKFLSVADIGFSPDGLPRYLDYHMAMGIWIAIGIVTGLYLLHIFRTSHDTPSDSVPAFQCLLAIGFLCTSAYITVGLFSAKPPRGALWQQIVAFAPPQLNIESLEVDHDGLKFSLDFDAAVATAEQSDLPMFLDFTGVNCINCRKMENTVLKADDVHTVLEDLVRVQLYTDIVPGVKKDSDVSNRILSRNLSLQEDWLKDTTLPTYVIATPDGKDILAVHTGFDEGGANFRKFLKTGLRKWKERNVSDVDKQVVKTKLTVHK